MDTSTSLLSIQNLHASIGDTPILKGLSLDIPKGQVHAIMGKNGSGKSTLAKVVSGHPDYTITSGDILFQGESIIEMEPNCRAHLGIFIAFQYPMEIPGVTIANFIRAAIQSRLKEGEEMDIPDYYGRLYKMMDSLNIPRSFTSRFLNEGFSGGEKKRCEILQMKMLNPTFALLDETDSGLDIDALKTVASGVNALRSSDIGMLVITHYQRLLEYIVPDVVHIMHQGKIFLSSDKSLALKLEEEGYDWIEKEYLATQIT